MTPAPALPQELTIYTAADSHALLRQWADAAAREDSDAPLRVDAAAVGEADAAGVQLLVALERTLQAQGRGLLLHAPSAALTAACGTLGAGFLLEATGGSTSPTRATPENRK